MTTPPQGDRWYPSPRKQAFDWYLTRMVRMLGAAGFAWELAIDKGRNPLTLLLSVQLAATMDVLGLVRGLIAQARMERKTLEELVTKDQDGSQ